jgi:hypothetical protein
MAHFARIEDGIVKEVIVVNNEVLLDESGMEQESLGVAFCKSLFGNETEWLQTSYSGSFRGLFAGHGTKYNAELDTFEVEISEDIDVPTGTE